MLGIGINLWNAAVQGGGVPLEDHTAYDFLPPNDNSSGGGVWVHIFDAGGLDIPDFTVSGIRLEVAGSLAAVYVGQQAASGDEYDAESLTQITFGGESEIVQGFDETTLSDFADFTWDKTSNLIVSSLGSTGNRLPSDVSEVVTEYAAGSLAADQVGDADKPSEGYSNNGGIVRGFSKIILYGN